MELLSLTLKQTSQAIKEKKISAKEVAQFYLARAKKFNPTLNAFIGWNLELEKQAQEIDEAFLKGKLNINHKMLGIPVGIKDLICTKGIQTTAASKILKDFTPPYDATLIQKLKNQGALILGKLNLDEFAMGSSNETSFFGAVKNPWDTSCVPGGSSGGSASAQAAGLASVTIGTDTGGSIRQPSHFCGVVGMKPTYGRISRYGIVAYASSLDQAGPMTNCVEDAALMLEVMCGHDVMDGTTSNRSVPEFSNKINSDIKGLNVGIMKEFMTDQLHPDVRKTIDQAIQNLKILGANIVEISIPLTKYAVPVYYLVAASEASSNLSRYDGVRYGYRHDFKDLSSVNLDLFYSKTRGEGFGTEVKRRILMGTHCLSSGYYDAYYLKASRVRRLIKNQFTSAFEKCQVILSPVSTTPAFKLGERISDPLAMYLNDIFTVSTNLAGIPALSLPYGISEGGLPIGVQLMANDFDEQTLLNFAKALENTSSVKGLRPKGFL